VTAETVPATSRAGALRSRSGAIWPALAAAAALLANASILGHFFFADDFANFLEVANVGAHDLLLNPVAGHMLVLRNAVTALWFPLFGMHAGAYFALALATHVANVLLVFGVARRLTGSAPLACFGALLFAIAPTNGGTLGWYAAYGHALATTFILSALLLLLDEDDRAPVSLPRALGIATCAIAATQCFATGTAVALVLPVVSLLLRPGLARRPLSALVVCSVPVLVALAATVLFTAKTRLHPNPTFDIRLTFHFAKDWARIVPMLTDLASIGTLTLLLGTLYPTGSYPDTASRILLPAFAAAVAAAVAFGTSRDRRRIAALLLVPAASYAAIAIGRASMIAAVRPDAVTDAVVNSPRYYYLGQAGLALLVSALLAQARRGGRLVPVASAILVLWMGSVVAGRWLWPPALEDFQVWRDRVRFWRGLTEGEIRKAPPGAVACVANKTADLGDGFPGTVGVYILYNHSDEFEGRRVYFTTSNPKVLALRLPGSRTASLLLSEGRCPPEPAAHSPG